MTGFVRTIGAALGLMLMLLFTSDATLAQTQNDPCVKVRSSFAHAVCDNVETKAGFLSMRVAYFHVLQPLSERARAAFVSDQRAWRDFATRACTQTGEIQESPYTDDQLFCVEELLWRRTNWLENNWNVGGVQTFPTGSYGVKPDSVNKIGPKMGKVVFSFSFMDDERELAEAFNEYAINGYATGELKAAIDPSDMTGETDSELYVRIYEITPARISSVVESSVYYHGAAHGTSGVTYDHYLTGENRGLVAGDIFSAPGWQKAFSELVGEAIASDPDLRGDVWEDISDALFVVVEPERWKFTAQGLEVQFQPYEIAAFARGLPSVTVPWDRLDGLLAPGALEIAGVR